MIFPVAAHTECVRFYAGCIRSLVTVIELRCANITRRVQMVSARADHFAMRRTGILDVLRATHTHLEIQIRRKWRFVSLFGAATTLCPLV